MPAPDIILRLVERFRDNAEAYRAVGYNETQVRREFLDPFFECLGWDIENKRGFAEAYKDVIHEDAIKIGGATKAPDYCFRVGGTRKFFLEAKKPAVSIKRDSEPAFQLRRYAWSAGLPLSILTNFAEFAVYDCRIKPAVTDKPSVARTLDLTYELYVDRWDDIANIFGRDAVYKGSFDKYAESNRLKRGTATVDAAFLEEIESWRDVLARNLALRNPKITQRELNYAVQATIDRILFLRMCEDRGIERYAQLQGLMNGPTIYPRFFDIFRAADERYNSGLFYFDKEPDRSEPPDELTPSLKLDDKPLRDIVKGLYYPDCPYEFSVLPAEILGQVYERFLGKVIRLTEGHQAKIEEKPEVRKAGGVYYTPTYIVDYIVKNTVGKLLEGKNPRQAAKLRILDPACGSGSFLLGAYRHLLDWHRDWYVNDGPEKHTKELYQGPGGLWRLITTEKRRILLNNIFGVDIDPQAVEVTKLSLLLKVLEGESKQTLETQLKLYHERALPDLARNIKCGNSLIGPDFYEGQQGSLFDDEERLRINVFDWNAEFSDIMKAGGFDAVIGNPPWGQKEIYDEEVFKHYVWQRYRSTAGIYDLFRPFVEQGIRLARKAGMFGMVLPDIVLLKDYPETRRYLLEQLALESIHWWGMAFAAAVIDASTLVGTKKTATEDHVVHVAVHDRETPIDQHVRQAEFWTNPRLTFNLFLTPAKRDLLKQLDKFPKLGEYFEVHEGVHSGNIREALFVDRRIDNSCAPLYFGRGEISPYHLQWDGRYIKLSAMPRIKTRTRYANIGQHDWHERDKLLVRRTGDYVLAAVDRFQRYASNNFFLVFPKQACDLNLDGVCALLNSEFMTWFFRTIEPRTGRVFAELKIKHLSTFPLPAEILENGGCKILNDLGARRSALAAQLAKPATSQEVAVRRRSADALDGKIGDTIRKHFGVGDLDGIFNDKQEMEHAPSSDREKEEMPHR